MSKKFEWFVAPMARDGRIVFGICCSHGFVKYTESQAAAEACVKAWNKPKKKIKKP